MDLRSLLAGVPIERGSIDLGREISTVTCDSRAVIPGALFVAIPGERENGQTYIEEALEKGALAVLCRDMPAEKGPYLATPDPRLALALVSANWFGHPGKEMKLIGVTGTNGKTTTTYLLKAMLEGVLHTRVGLIGTNRNLIGDREIPAQRTTPDAFHLQSLLRQMADEGCTHVAMEVSSHALMQHRTAGLRFAVGLFTNLSRDHLDYHRTMEEYRAAKGRLFTQSERAVINLDDEL